MKEKQLKSWEDFEKEIESIFKKYQYIKSKRNNEDNLSSSLFSVGDILDWLGFFSKLIHDKNDVSPSKRILNLLPQDIKILIENSIAVNNFSEEDKSKIINSLNDLLSQKDFYQEQNFLSIDISIETKDILKPKKQKNLSIKEIQSLNRLLIETSYPHEIVKRHYIYHSPPLFRGHADSNWELKTTLERHINPKGDKNIKIKMSEYFTIIKIAETHIKTLTSFNTNVPMPEKFEYKFNRAVSGYEFMAYLRHYGFPSPLLDWSESPYVAAFFAFDGIIFPSEGDVAIYVYQEHVGHGKIRYDGEANIDCFGPTIITHRRHFLQQCEYTICCKENNGIYYYGNHEEAFSMNDEEQNILVKFTIPKNECEKVRNKVNLMNINKYSLFGTDEAMIETIANKIDFVVESIIL